MKIVVVGGAGRVGAGVVSVLADYDVEVTVASRRTGVDVISRVGLEAALAGADVVVDVVNAPSFEDDSALAFFEASTRNLLAQETLAGVGQHVALSVVGAERLTASSYFRAKLAQERQVQAASVPHTILRSTQFFEFLSAIVEDGAEAGSVRVPPARIQPIAADDVARALAKLALAPPLNTTVEVAGPDTFRLDTITQAFMAATGDPRRLLADPRASYFGVTLAEETLMAGGILRFGHTDFDAWLRGWVREHPPTARPSAPAIPAGAPSRIA